MVQWPSKQRELGVAGVEGLEPPTLGLENPSRTVPPVWHHAFSVGYDTSHSGHETPFGHEYAPHYAPRPGSHDASSTAQSVDGFLPLQSILPALTISKRRLKQLEAIQLVRGKRENRNQEISYNARPFVVCGLPLRQLPKDQLIYTRRNGNFLLEITAHPRFGLPYGQDRLIPIWLATLAFQQKSPTLHFDSPSQLLDYFRLRKDGSQYRRIRGAFQRVFAATIFFGSEDQLKKHLVVDWTRFHFFDEMRLWFNHEDNGQPPAEQTPCNVVVLSDAFYRELTEHPIPVERDVVAALAHAPGLLDFYIWITWKSWTVNGRPARVPLFGPNGLTNQLGTRQYSVERLFRHKISQWLGHVKQLWPECPACVSDDGLFLVICSSRKLAPIKPVERAVNP